MLPTELPTRPEDFTLEILNRIIASHMPEAELSAFEVTEHHLGAAAKHRRLARVTIKSTYLHPTEEKPEHFVIKVAKTVPWTVGDANQGSSGSPQLYANEVNVYTRLRPSAFIESPICLGGAFDANTTTFLLLEDLRDRGGVRDDQVPLERQAHGVAD